jgi:hypothetical protein
MDALNPRLFIEFLVEKCRSHDSPQPSCPLASLRAEPSVSVRRERLAKMSNAEVDELFQGHIACVRKICGV